MTGDGPTTLRTCYGFFVPLIFMTELNMISKAVINAALARMDDSAIALAGFHCAFTLYFSIASGTEICTLLTLSYLRSKRALGRLLRFMAVIVGVPWVIAQFIAFTSLGDWLFATFFNVNEATIGQAKLSTFILSLSAPVLICRSICFGLLMRAQRTICITYATFARLASLAGWLIALPLLLEGAAVGTGALVLCMLTETVLAAFYAARVYAALPATGEEPPNIRTQWRFSWPVMLNTTAEMGVVFVVSIFIGRLAEPELALAAFSVVYSLVSLLMSPLRNLVQTAQTLVRTDNDRRILLIFTAQQVPGFAAFTALLFLTPLSGFVLADLQGLEPVIETYCAPAMRIAFLMALVWSFSAVFRGLLAGARRTGALAVSGVARIGAATAVSAVALAYPDANGAVIGLAAWMAGFAVESVLLGHRVLGISAGSRAPRGRGYR